MNITKLLRDGLLFITLCVGLQSCKTDKDMEISSAFQNYTPEKVQLLEYNSKSITIAWDFIKDARSYTVQLLSSPDSDYPLYTYTTDDEDYYEFASLNPRQSYYARVRANYPNSATSNWIYVQQNSEKARIIPQYGIVDQDFEIIYIKNIQASNSTLTAEWSFTDFANMDSEITKSFDLYLYKDPACTDLEISWKNITGIFAASTTSLPKPLRFTFSGLAANTSYYLKVKDNASSFETPAFAMKTANSASIQVASNPTVTGDVILHQDFRNFIHGGDILFKAGGYNATTAAGRAQWHKAQGDNPVNTDLGQSFCDLGAEFNVFDGGNVTIDYTKGVGMEGWGKSGNTSTRPGYIKIGGSGAVGILYTPILSYSGNLKTVEVSFKAAVYSEGLNNYCDKIVIENIEGAQFSAKGAISNLANVIKKDSKALDISDAIGKFENYTVTLTNVSPNSRIAFSSDPSGTSTNKTRFLIDDIIIKLK